MIAATPSLQPGLEVVLSAAPAVRVVDEARGGVVEKYAPRAVPSLQHGLEKVAAPWIDVGRAPPPSDAVGAAVWIDVGRAPPPSDAVGVVLLGVERRLRRWCT